MRHLRVSFLGLFLLLAIAAGTQAQTALQDPALATVGQAASPWTLAVLPQQGDPGLVKAATGRDGKPGVQLKAADGSYRPAAMQQKLALPAGLYELTVWAKGAGSLLLQAPGNDERTQPLHATWGQYGFLFDWPGGDASPIIGVFGDGVVSEAALLPATAEQRAAWTKQQESLRQFGFITHAAQRPTPGGEITPPANIKPLEAMTRCVVFWDERLDSVGQATHQERLVKWLVANGFPQMKCETLAAWMTARIDNGDAYGSVVVMTMGYAPAQLAEEGGDKILWKRYLRAGGRIVSIGDLPFNYYEYPDTRPLPSTIAMGESSINALGLTGGWNQPYWGRGLEVAPSPQARDWGFETVDGAITGFAVETISIPFDRYTVPETGKLGAGSWMKNIRPDMPWSGLIKMCQMFDGRNDAQLRDVWRAAHYVGKPFAVPALPAPWAPPKEPDMAVQCTASGIPGRTEFARGEEVRAQVALATAVNATAVRLDLLQADGKLLAHWEQPAASADGKPHSAAFQFSTAPYAFGAYQLRTTAYNNGQAVATSMQTIGIRYVPPISFCWQPLTGVAPNALRRDMTYAELKQIGMEPMIGPDVAGMDAILRQNMGFTLRLDSDLLGGKEYSWEKNPEYFRLDINRKPIPSAYAGGRPTLGISHPELQANLERGMYQSLKTIANHPGFRPYAVTNDDWSIYYGADFTPRVVQQFKAQTGLDAPTKMELPPVGAVDENNPWLRWFEYTLKEVDGGANRAETRGARAARADIRLGPIPGGMQIPLIQMWEPTQYPPLNFGKNGFNLLCFYYYNTYWQPVITNTYWSDISRMSNRDLPEWCMPDIFMTAGYQRNNLFHLLAGGMKGLSYFIYDSRNPETWSEVKRLAPQVRRFGPVQWRLQPAEKKDIGLLLSFTTNCFDPGHDLIMAYAYANLMQAHYDVEPVGEEELLAGRGSHYKAILLYDVKWLRQSVYTALQHYAAAGGTVLLDNTIPFDIPGARRVSIDIGMGKQKTLGVPPEGAHVSVPGIHDYGNAERIAVIQQALSQYVKPSFACPDIRLVANRFQADGVPYTWFVNAYNGQEYIYCRERMGAGHPGANTPEKIAELIAWEKQQLRAGPFTTSVTYATLPGIPYDLVAGKPVPVRKTAAGFTLTLAMERFGGSLVAFYPAAITAVALKAPVQARALQEVAVSLEVRGKNTIINGAIPLEITLLDPHGNSSPLSGVRATEGGRYTFRWTPAINDPTGNWTLRVKELASGKTVTATVRVSGGSK